MAKRQYRKFTSAQTAVLMEEFGRSIYATPEKLEALSEKLSAPVANIRVWYNNQRVKAKKSSQPHGDNQHPNQGMEAAHLQNGYQGSQGMPTTNQNPGYAANPMPRTQQERYHNQYNQYHTMQPFQEVAPPPNLRHHDYHIPPKNYWSESRMQQQPQQAHWNGAWGREGSMTQSHWPPHETQTYNTRNPDYQHGSSTFQQNYPSYQPNSSSTSNPAAGNTSYAMNGYNQSDYTFKATQPTEHGWSQPPANGYLNELLDFPPPPPPPTCEPYSVSQQITPREDPMRQCIKNPEPERCTTANTGRKRRTRTMFTDYQQSQLKAQFEVSDEIQGQEKKDLAKRLGLTPNTIRFYFKNRRAGKRKDSKKAEKICTSEVVQDVATITEELASEKPHGLSVEEKQEEEMCVDMPANWEQKLDEDLANEIKKQSNKKKQEERLYLDMPSFGQMLDEAPLNETETLSNKTLLADTDKQPNDEKKQEERVYLDMPSFEQMLGEAPLNETETLSNKNFLADTNKQPIDEERQEEEIYLTQEQCNDVAQDLLLSSDEEE